MVIVELYLLIFLGLVLTGIGVVAGIALRHYGE